MQVKYVRCDDLKIESRLPKATRDQYEHQKDPKYFDLTLLDLIHHGFSLAGG